MTLYEVLWDNGEPYEDKEQLSLIFTSLEKAEEYYDSQNQALAGFSYYDETISIWSFESDVEHQPRTLIAEKRLEFDYEANGLERVQEGGDIGDLDDAMG